ncbi:MAG: hypothetical protein Hyperionvirus10_61 [Hyperionvirus sp.]|uniref:Uncharacterized protein n=1 Tax=Hyperionvirus sp. TaxID=2487770 RepID=A0A3G5A911_9VIRU|nr:MAG: hypothetical protein Hyperionvirus10_61 [Hyperionvirus sp.]
MAVTAHSLLAGFEYKDGNIVGAIDQLILDMICAGKTASEHPSVIILGRRLTSRTYACHFDSDANARIFHVDNSPGALANYRVDFNNSEELKKLFASLTKESIPVLILFDVSTFKFVADIPSFLTNVSTAMPKGCRLIFQYEVAGGGITPVIPTHPGPYVHKLNHICVPIEEALFGKTRDEIKGEIFSISKDAICAQCLSVGFSDVQLKLKSQYPFIAYKTPSDYIIATV